MKSRIVLFAVHALTAGLCPQTNVPQGAILSACPWGGGKIRHSPLVVGVSQRGRGRRPGVDIHALSVKDAGRALVKRAADRRSGDKGGDQNCRIAIVIC